MPAKFLVRSLVGTTPVVSSERRGRVAGSTFGSSRWLHPQVLPIALQTLNCLVLAGVCLLIARKCVNDSQGSFEAKFEMHLTCHYDRRKQDSLKRKPKHLEPNRQRPPIARRTFEAKQSATADKVRTVAAKRRHHSLGEVGLAV